MMKIHFNERVIIDFFTAQFNTTDFCAAIVDNNLCSDYVDPMNLPTTAPALDKPVAIKPRSPRACM